METRIIKAVFGASKSIVAPKRFKNDWGQVLELVGITLPQTFTAHFANSKTGMAKKRIGQNNKVDVPDEFFTSGADIYCWVMVHDTVSDGRTMYTVRIPIEDRGTATDEEPTPVQQDAIEQAIAALNAAVEKTAQDVESADASAQSAKADADRAETARDTAEEYVSTVQEYAQQAQASANSAASSATSSASSASQAQQIKTDIESMVDEAQSAAGASAQSALESAQSASQASASAASANQSAETASTKASEASTSAQTAGAKATEASGYASTASEKASESSQSASAASGYATQAGQAKTAAETAQGLAEQAQSDAESAKDDAESARDEAQQIASGISGKVEQIDQNTADIADLEADMYKAYVTDTATGAVASFPDGADDVPMKDVTVQIEPVQDLSHGDPSPDNICPISGWSGVNVSRVGKNLCPINTMRTSHAGIDYTVTDEGIRIHGTATTSSYSWTNSIDYASTWLKIPAGTYTFSVTDMFGENQIDGCVVFMGWDINGTAVSSFTLHGGSTTNTRTFANDVGLYYGVYVKSGLTVDTVVKIQTELGSTATAYEPYTGQTYPITFPSEAGTVYGGSLTIAEDGSGVLTVDRAMADMGSLVWNYNTTYAFFTSSSIPTRKIGILNVWSDLFKTMAGSWSGTPMQNALWGNGSNTTLYVQISSLDNVDDFMALVDGHQLMYELATPIHYPLTPTEIKTLLGQNNVWADTGDVSVEYRADTKLYIEKLTQPEEDDMIADSAISKGRFFMVGNSLYRALANIASGATITVGTNAQRVSLSDALNLVNA